MAEFRWAGLRTIALVLTIETQSINGEGTMEKLPLFSALTDRLNRLKLDGYIPRSPSNYVALCILMRRVPYKGFVPFGGL